MKIDIYFDTICPWCWVGKHNIEKAIEMWDGEGIEVNYKPYFLYEGIPDEGIYVKDHLRQKYNMDEEQEKQYMQMLQSQGRESGVEFNLGKIEFIPNTVSSHLLIEMTSGETKRNMIERVFYEAFNQRKNLGDINFLKLIAKEFDVSINEFEEIRKDPDQRSRIHHLVNQAKLLGIRGVPFYVINDKYAIYGAQKPDIFLQTFRQVHNEKNMINLT